MGGGHLHGDERLLKTLQYFWNTTLHMHGFMEWDNFYTCNSSVILPGLLHATRTPAEIYYRIATKQSHFSIRISMLEPYTHHSARKSPENTYKLMGFYMGI